jgi:hypothetical protein
MTRGQGPRDLEERTQRAMIGHAIFRLESALTIALVIILVFFYPQPFHWWKWWYWVVVGLVGEVAIIYTSLTDLRTGQRVVAEMLRQEFNPSEITVPKYRERVEKALEYRARIEGTIESREKGVLQDHLHDTLQGIADWIGNIYRLSKRLAAYESDALVKRDMQNIPKSLRAYRARLEQEDSPDVRRQIEEAIERQEAHRGNLLDLQDVMEKAEFQLEATLAALGTVHSQLLLIGAKDIDGARSRQIAQKIRDQVNQLQDILTTMDEVYRHG